jgi:NTP pyrophosphatase (non-canonical NTP hydrolase)
MMFSDLLQRAIAVRELYSKYEKEHYGSSWTKEELALGFIGDVGDLAKLILAANGRREIPDATDRLAHELADCLWSLLVIAHAYDVDLEQAFLQTMEDLERHLAGQ